MAVDVVTFGCRLNAVESEAMRRAAQAAGLDEAIIVNTCAVTAEATRQARQAIRRLKRGNPDARVIVTGCAAQIEPERFAAMPEVDQVIGNGEKRDRGIWRALADPSAGLERVAVADIMAVRDTAPQLLDGFEGRTRAFVQVQNGCDHRCTFCVIPYGRGPSRSVPMGAVVDQIRALVANGYAEAVLTGVDITSWGADLPGAPRLGTLVKSVLRHVPELQRLRLSSIDSIEADDDLLDALGGEARLMPHLHLSLQAGDDLTLKRMKRRHKRDDALRLCERLRRLRPDIVLGADLIAGFPTETEAMFERSLALIADCGLTFVHVFPFSPRPGTPAAKMPGLPSDIVKDRARRLREEGARALVRYLDGRIGRAHKVLVESAGLGRTEGFVPVRLRGERQAGRLVDVTIGAHDGRSLAEGDRSEP